MDYEVTLVSWVENEECVNGDDGAVVKRIERDKTIGKDDWKCPHDLDSVHIRGRVWVDGDEAKSVDYGEIPPDTSGSQDAAVYLVDEDLVTSTGAAVCPGIDAVVKKLRVGEISTAIIRKDYGFSDGVLNHRVDRHAIDATPRHAIDATPARWRGGGGLSPLDGASTTQWLISTGLRTGPSRANLYVVASSS